MPKALVHKNMYCVKIWGVKLNMFTEYHHESVCGYVTFLTMSLCFFIADAPGENALNKAILLGATFLVDFMYFEINNNN